MKPDKVLCSTAVSGKVVSIKRKANPTMSKVITGSSAFTVA